MIKSENKICQNCKQDFIIEPEDFQFYEKMKVPAPTWCPECRLKRRFSFATDRSLYKRVCDLCGKDIISSYPGDKGIIVYCNNCWWSDKWDGAQYAQGYDPSLPFLKQVKQLISKTPKVALDSNYPTLVNSEYVNHCATAKNCYLIFTADECENVLYSEFLLNDKDCMDSTILEKAELCYGNINCGNSYRLLYSEDCDSCQNVLFSKDCIGCSNCFSCVGLRNKQFNIFNQQYSREEYEKKVKGFGAHSYRNVQEIGVKAREFWLTRPHKYAHAVRNANTTGDYVYGAKNSRNMYIVSEGSENSRYCQLITMSKVKDAYDYTIWGNGVQRIYESLLTGESADTIKFSFQVWPNVRNIEYSFFVISSAYMFGCANIRNKKYCILNKEYSKEEFESLRERIIKEMNENPYVDAKGRIYKYGEFFPNELSLSGYNESYAMDFFPLTREEAIFDGYNWYEPQPSAHKATLRLQDVPDSIHDVDDSILNEIIECAQCKKPFKIIASELSLLRRFAAPIPRKCPNCRYRERLSHVNPPRLYRRNCMCQGASSLNSKFENTVKHQHGDVPCTNEFETSYAPDRPEIVYCEQCYQAEVA